MGYNYTDSPLVVADGSVAPSDEAEKYIQTARPGHRAPHYWLDGGKLVIELLGNGFVLRCLGTSAPDEIHQNLVDATHKVGLPLECITIKDAKVADPYQARLVLFVQMGWLLCEEIPFQMMRGLVDRVRGVSVTKHM